MDSVDNDYKVKPEGHLVMFSCGHRGQPTRIEEKRISRLLRKSGFIPMLDEASNQKDAKSRDKGDVSPKYNGKGFKQDDLDQKFEKFAAEKTAQSKNNQSIGPGVKIADGDDGPTISPEGEEDE